MTHVLAVVALLLPGCPQTDIEPVFALPISTSPGVVASESWAAYSPPGGVRPGRLVVQYNDFSGTFFGWSWSDNGVDWNACNANLPQCGPGGAAVLQMAPGMAAWRGDPAIAAAQDGSGAVVATNMATTPNSGGEANRVVAMLSLDGGRTFESTVMVNPTGPCSDDLFDIDAARDDQQAIAWDQDTDVFYIAWRHRQRLGAAWGVCMRAGIVDRGARRIVWLDASAHPGPGLGSGPGGVGGIHLAAGGGSIMLAYVDTPAGALDCGIHGANWYSDVSSDFGRTWARPTHFITGRRATGGCVGSNGFLVSERAFGITRDSRGNWWAAVQTGIAELGVYLFRPSAFGDGSWDPVIANLGGAGIEGILYPTIAADHEGRVAVSFTGWNGGTGYDRWFAAHRFGVPEWLVEALPTPFFPPANFPARGLGDFDVMTAVGPPMDAFLGGATFMTTYAATDIDGVSVASGVEVVSHVVRVNDP